MFKKIHPVRIEALNKPKSTDQQYGVYIPGGRNTQGREYGDSMQTAHTPSDLGKKLMLHNSDASGKIKLIEGDGIALDWQPPATIMVRREAGIEEVFKFHALKTEEREDFIRGLTARGDSLSTLAKYL